MLFKDVATELTGSGHTVDKQQYVMMKSAELDYCHCLFLVNEFFKEFKRVADERESGSPSIVYHTLYFQRLLVRMQRLMIWLIKPWPLRLVAY